MTRQPGGISDQPTFRERLYTPWWWYLAGVAVAVLLGVEVALAIPYWWGWILVGLLVLAALSVVWRFSSGMVVVSDGILTTGERSLPLAAVHSAVGLSANELRLLVGRHSDPTARVFIRSWVGPGVQLVVRDTVARDTVARDTAGGDSAERDASDIEPYWVVSTRHPDRLLAVLAAESVTIR